MLEEFKADLDRYVLMDEQPWWLLLLTKQSLWAIAQYRFSRWVHFHVHIPGIRLLLKIICAVWQKLIEIITGSELPNRTEIGKGLYIPHANGIFIHCDVKIGDYCNLHQQVAIGVAGRGEKQGCPTLGDRVFIGPGAKIFGAISIGNDVAIGANAVVTKDLPDRAVSVGVPGEIISDKGSEDLMVYREASESTLEVPTHETN